MLGNFKKISIEKSLTTRLLLLTIFSVLTVEIFFYVPSIANFRLTWIEQKLAEANIAIMVVEATPDFMVSRLLTDQLLASSENYSIIRQFPDGGQQALMHIDPFEISKQVDIRTVSWLQSIKDALGTMINMNRTGFLIEARANAVGEESEEIIIVFDEHLLCADMLDYSLNILIISIIISVFVGIFLYYNLSRQLVLPVEKITGNLIAFRNAPEDMTKRFEPDNRKDEIGVVMRELAIMQDEVRRALNQRIINSA